MPIHKALFLTHGEEEQMIALKDRVAAYGIATSRVVLPGLDDEVDLSSAGDLILTPPAVPRLSVEKPSSPDWDNDLAELVNTLRDGFEAAADDKARAVYVRRMRRALQADA